MLGFRILCSQLPELCGDYEQQFTDEYHVMKAGGNILMKHPVDGVWCVTNNDTWLARSEDTPTQPIDVRFWNIWMNNRMVPCRSIQVTSFETGAWAATRS